MMDCEIRHRDTDLDGDIDGETDTDSEGDEDDETAGDWDERKSRRSRNCEKMSVLLVEMDRICRPWRA